jgi:hypothetical protein
MPDEILFNFQKKIFQHISNQHNAELYKEMTEFLDPEYDDEMEAIEMIKYVDGKEESEYVENESDVVQQSELIQQYYYSNIFLVQNFFSINFALLCRNS